MTLFSVSITEHTQLNAATAIFPQKSEKKRFITILLSRDKSPGVMNWRCYSCGSIVFQYFNSPRAIFEGAISIDDLDIPTDHLCKKCNIVYRVT